MYKFEIVECKSPNWEKIVNSSCLFDFHHSSFYHKIDNDYTSVLLYAGCEEGFIALPLVLRPINETSLFDCTSVYGYSGPISNKENFDFKDSFIKFFQSELKKFCIDRNIVSIFSRLHPLINQNTVLKDLGEVVPLNKTVVIDLRLSPDDQKKQYRKSNKSEINQLRKKGFIVEESKRREDIDRFIEIYFETMDRVNASPSYYFSKEYFYSFIESKQFVVKLLLAKKDEKIVAGAIFTQTKKIMQYHLAGTDNNYIKDTPMKLILDEARLIGNKLGLEFLHLGGGVGGSDEDALFKFKAGFSDLFCQFSVWKYVVNEVKYLELVKAKGIVDVKSNFFPLYRL